MAGAAEVLALSDDEDTPRSKFKPPSRAGTRKCAPTTLGELLKVCVQRWVWVYHSSFSSFGAELCKMLIFWGGHIDR